MSFVNIGVLPGSNDHSELINAFGGGAKGGGAVEGWAMEPRDRAVGLPYKTATQTISTVIRPRDGSSLIDATCAGGYAARGIERRDRAAARPHEGVSRTTRLAIISGDSS